MKRNLMKPLEILSLESLYWVVLYIVAIHKTEIYEAEKTKIFVLGTKDLSEDLLIFRSLTSEDRDNVILIAEYYFKAKTR